MSDTLTDTRHRRGRTLLAALAPGAAATGILAALQPLLVAIIVLSALAAVLLWRELE